MKTTVNCPQGAVVTIDCACTDTTEEVILTKKSTEATQSSYRHIPKATVEDWAESWLASEHSLTYLAKRDGFSTTRVAYNTYKHIATTSISAMRKLVRTVEQLTITNEELQETLAERKNKNISLIEAGTECERARMANEEEIRDLRIKIMMLGDTVQHLRTQ